MFAKEAANMDSSTSKDPPAPTIFTGERIMGTFSIFQIARGDAAFDTVDIVLRGLLAKYKVLLAKLMR